MVPSGADVAGSTRVTVPSWSFGTHTSPPITSRFTGSYPALTVAVTLRVRTSRRLTVPETRLVNQTASPVDASHAGATFPTGTRRNRLVLGLIR